MLIELQDIVGLTLPRDARWQVRVLAVEGRSPALHALIEWKRKKPADYKRIIKAIREASLVHRVTNEKWVKKADDPRDGDIYEFRAHTGTPRLMFFYDESERALIICTNAHDKGNDDQGAAFKKCAHYKILYEANYHDLS